ncbi:MAG TPA: hypothetical protein DEV81_10845, partial [Cyanobacteria bacterium UBA11049]|nr:hypothetical protein [Cyanobacteria bacterium UBA11049]
MNELSMVIGRDGINRGGTVKIMNAEFSIQLDRIHHSSFTIHHYRLSGLPPEVIELICVSARLTMSGGSGAYC